MGEGFDLELKTTHLTIKEIDQETAQQQARYDGGQAVQAHMATLSEEALLEIVGAKAQLQELFDMLEKIAHSQDKQYFGAFLKGRQIGCITWVNPQSNCPELQIEIQEGFRGHGYGREFLNGFLKGLFEKRHRLTVQYTVMLSNKPSLALARKIGFLQESNNPVERFFVKRYHISALSKMAYRAHEGCTNHKPELEKDSRCGCFYCLKSYDPKEIEEWLIADNNADRRGTALCPYCGIDAVIGEYSGYPITKEFLEAMYQIWFTAG